MKGNYRIGSFYGRIKAFFASFFSPFKSLFTWLQLRYLSAGYFFHLWIRMAHDKTYEKVPVYRNYTNKKYSSGVHKAVLTAFVVSLVVFTTLQYLLPIFNPFKPGSVEASALSKTWTTTADFNSTGQQAVAPTSDGNLSIGTNAGDDGNGSLQLANTAGTYYGLGEDGPLTISSSYSLLADNVSGVKNTDGSKKTTAQTGRTGVDGFTTTLTQAVPNTGSSTLVVADASGFSTVGSGLNEEVFVARFWQAADGTTDLTRTDIAKVSSINIGTKTITLTASIFGRSADAVARGYEANITVVQRVPHYSNVTVNSGGVITTNAYNGTSGGAVVFRASGTLTVNVGGKIDTSSLGYGPTIAGPGGGTYGTSVYGDCADGCGAGGGGAYGGAGGASGRYGNISGVASPGGTAYSSIINLGSGGGGNSDPTGVPGLYGGGLVHIATPSFNNSGTGTSDGVRSNGQSNFDIAQGGGAGGSINIVASTYSGTGKVMANGGSGSTGTNTGSYSPGGGGGGGGRIKIVSATAQGSITTPVASGGAGGGAPDVNRPAGVAGTSTNLASPSWYQSLTPYVAAGNLGTGGTGLRFDNSPSKSKWIDLKVKGNVPTNTSVKFQVRSSDIIGTGSFVNPTSYTQTDVWSATIPPGVDYSTNAYTLVLDSAMPLSKTLEVIMLVEGGAATPRIDSIQLDYDGLNVPTNPKQYKVDATTEVVSGSYTNETSFAIKADVPDMTPIPTTSETLTPQIELVTGASPVFTGTATSFPAGGVSYNLNTLGYTGATVSTNFGTLSGLAPATTYNWKIRFTDQAGRVGPWSSAKVLNVDQTVPTLSISFASAYAASTSTTVTFTAADADSKLYKLYLTNSSNNTGWQDVTASITGSFIGQSTCTNCTVPWTLSSGDGTKNVYAKVLDTAGNTSKSTLSGQTDFAAGSRGPDVANKDKTLYKLKDNGVTAASASECISNYVSAGVCAANADWQSGVGGMAGKYVFTRNVSATDKYTDGTTTGTNALKWYVNNTTNCIGPQCTVAGPVAEAQAGYTGKKVLVADNNVDFTSYYARDACKVLGGRLPTIAELGFIYTDKASYSNLTTTNSYWSATEDAANYAWLVSMTNGTPGQGYKSMTPSFVRCIADSLSSLGGTGTAGTYLSPVIDAGSAISLASIDWSAQTPGSSAVSFQLKAGNTATPNSSWTNNNSWTTVSSGVPPFSLNTYQYFQYQATFTANVANVPTLYNVSLAQNYSASIILDTAAPTGAVAINSGAQYTKQAAVTLTNSATDGSGSGIYQMQFSNDGSSWSTLEAYNATKAWTLSSGDGAKTVYARFTDNAGNVGGITAVTNPSSPWAVPAGITSVGVTIKGAGGGGGGGGEDYNQSDGGPGNPGGNTTVTYGSFTQTARGGGGGAGGAPTSDGADGSSGSYTTQSGFSGTGTDGGGSGGGSGGSGVSNGGRGGSGGPSGILTGTISGLSGGNISIIRGAGGTGGAGASANGRYAENGGTGTAGEVVISYGVSVQSSITLDTVAPTFNSVTPATNAYRKVGDATFTLSESLQAGAYVRFASTTAVGGESIGGQHTYTLTGAELTTLTSQTKTVTGLVNGNLYTLSFSGSDLAGNATTTANNTGITYDTTAPTAAVTYSLSKPLKSGDPLTITATFSEIMQDSPVPQVSISGSNTRTAINMTKSSATVYIYVYTVGTGNGTATVALNTGVDRAGNVVTSGPTSGATFTVDNTPPTYNGAITLSNGSNWVKQGSIQIVTVNFSENMLATPKIAIDYAGTGSDIAATNMTQGANASVWSYTATIPSENDGTATVSFSSLFDLAGNAISGSPSGNTFGVDNGAPTGSVSALSQFYNTAAINVPYTTTDSLISQLQSNVAFGCDTGEWNTCTGEISNPSATNISFPPIGILYAQSGEGIITIYNNATFVTSFSFQNSQNIPSYNGIGNKITWSWTDTSWDGSGLSGAATFVGSQALSGVNYSNLYYTRETQTPYTWIKYVGTPTNSTASPFSFDTAQIVDATKSGNYGFRIVGTDNAGNVAATLGSSDAPDRTTVIDLVKPTGTAAFKEGTASANATTPLTLNITGADTGGSNLSSYQLSVDGAVWETAVNINGAPTSFTSGDIPRTVTLTEGKKYAYVRLTDLAGNTSTSEIKATMAFDITNPLIGSITGIKSNVDGTVINQVSWYAGTTPKFTLTGSDGAEGSGIKSYWVYLGPDVNGDPLDSNLSANNRFSITAEGDSTGIVNRNLVTSGISEGHVYFRAKSVDNVNRISDSLASFTYNFDKTAPQAAVSGLTASTTTPDQIDLSWPALELDENEATIENFKIERIKNSVYTANLLTPGGVWAGTFSENQTNGYALITTTNLTGYSDMAANTPPSFPSILGGVRYIYRISYKDTANDSYSPLPNSNLLLAIGLTKDNIDPASPSNVEALACNGVDNCTTETMQNGRTHKGHEVMITWDPSTDLTPTGEEGSGVGGYLIYRKNGNSMEETGWDLVGQLEDPAQTVWYDNDARNLATNTEFKQTASPLVNDFTYYYYRVVAYDMASPDWEERNTSGILPNEGVDFGTLNLNQHTMQTPDVTAPTVPTGAGVRRDGVDGANPLHQELNVYWNSSFVITDNDPQGIVGNGYKIYGYGPTATLESPSIGSFTDKTSSFTVKPNSPGNSFIIKGLDDYSYYYYFVEVYDRAGNIARTATFSQKTGNSQMPGPVTNVTLNTVSDLSNSDLGNKANLTFFGGNTPGCQAADGADCVTSYEVYLSQTNNQANCGVLSDDACWLDQNDTTQVIIEDLANKTKNLSGKDYHHTFGNLTDATTYFVRIRAKANTSDPDLTYSFLQDPAASATTPDVSAPALPSEVKIKDIHDDGLAFKRNIITWKRIVTPLRNGVNDFSQYKIYRSLDGLSWQQICQSGTSTILRSSCDAPNGQYPNPLYKVSQEEGLANNYFIDLIPISEQNMTYYYYVTALDNAGTEFKDVNGTVVYAHSNESTPNPHDGAVLASVSLNPATTQPSITTQGSGLKAVLTNVGVATATISWITDQPCDSMVGFRKGGTSDAYKQIGSGDSSRSLGMVTSHAVNLFGLQPGTTYEYTVVSRNFLSNAVVAEGNAVPALTTSGFNISAVKTDSTTTSAIITWTTNIQADGNYVEYQMQRQPGDDNISGTSGQDMSPVLDANTQTLRSNLNQAEINAHLINHKVVIGGLKSSRTYSFKIRSVSTDGFVAYSSFSTFATKTYDTAQFSLAPAASNVADRNITSTTAQIVWQTAVPTTSWIEYGTKTGSYGTSAGDNALSTTHVVNLTGLVPGTKYFYRATVKDGNDVGYTSPEYSFTAVIKPKISNLRISNVTSYTVTISWETNVDTETVLNWGKTAAYGEKKGTSGRSMVHQVVIEGLDDNQEYHYQIVAHDDAGNEVVGTDELVRTPLDTEGPKITNVKTDIMPLGDTDSLSQVIVSWTTNKPATTKVEFDEGIIGGRYTKSSTEDITLNNSHTVIIKGLNVATTYHYRIVTRDKRGNITISNDYTFVTPAKETSIWQLIVKSLTETFAWTKNMGSLFKRK